MTAASLESTRTTASGGGDPFHGPPAGLSTNSPPPKHGVRCCARTATRWLDRHNGKIERHQRLLADECLYARAYASENERRNAISVWNHHYNYHPPHTTRSDQPPASRLCTRVNNVMASYT